MQLQPARAAVVAAATPPPPPLPARRHRQPLRVAACHRCLLQPGRQLIPRQQLCGSGRSLSSAAALKEGSAAERQAAPDAPPAAPQQAGAQPPAEREQQPEGQQQDSAGVRAALAMLRFYKAAISPLLPPACRFLPTCSAYSMDAFKQYGVGKGFVLTAWRLLRCTPWGNSGYDPVRWPPPGLEAIFRE